MWQRRGNWSPFSLRDKSGVPLSDSPLCPQVPRAEATPFLTLVKQPASFLSVNFTISMGGGGGGGGEPPFLEQRANIFTMSANSFIAISTIKSEDSAPKHLNLATVQKVPGATRSYGRSVFCGAGDFCWDSTQYSWSTCLQLPGLFMDKQRFCCDDFPCHFTWGQKEFSPQMCSFLHWALNRHPLQGQELFLSWLGINTKLGPDTTL